MNSFDQKNVKKRKINKEPRKIQDLPDEVIRLILKYLNRSDIASCSKTCQRWNQIIPKSIYEIIDGREIALNINIKGDDMVKFFKNDKSLEKHLVKIWQGKSSMGCPLERHNYLIRFNEGTGSANFDKNSDIIKWANRLFIKENKIDDMLNEICGELFDSDKMANGVSYNHNHFRRHYIPYVLVPEGIIYYMMKTKELSYREANEIFMNEQCATDESISKSTMDSSEVTNESGPTYQDHQVNDIEDEGLEIPDFDQPDSDFEKENEDNN